MFLSKIKARTLWIVTGVIFVAVALVVVALAFVPKEYTTVLVVVMVIGFVLMTFSIQAAAFKSFKFKPKKDPVHPKVFHTEVNIQEVLKKNKYKERQRAYGKSFLRVDKPNAFKVTIVTDADKYFNPETEEESSSNSELDKCDRMIAFEIFVDYKEEDIVRLEEYSIQAKNIYYTAFYYKDGNYICANYVAPEEVHQINFDRLMEELGFVEVVEERVL